MTNTSLGFILKKMKNPEPPILFFDGVCNLCNGLINWLIDHLEPNQIKFASLQSEATKKYLNSKMIEDLDTVVLWESGKIHTRSDAILKTLALIGGKWSFLKVLFLFPKPLRDWAYTQVAKNRYFIFGKQDVCRLPTDKDRQYFL